MASAALLSLEEGRDTQRPVEIRPRLHERVNQWLDNLEARVKEAQPTLEELPRAGFALRQELTQWATEGVVERAHWATPELRAASCPPREPTLSARGSGAPLMETLVGAMRLRRPSCYGERRRLGSAPLDEALQRTARRQPPDAQQAAVQSTKEIPSDLILQRSFS